MQRKLTPEERIARFLAKPPRRISPQAVAARKSKTCRSNQRKWLPSLIRQQKGLCYFCKAPITLNVPRGPQRQATLDHYKPLAKGGPNDRSNLVAACFDCNQAKGCMEPEEFIAMCDSGRLPQGEDSRSEVECEASQSGGAEGAASPTPTPPNHPSNREAT